MNAGEKSVYPPNLFESVGSNASSEESGAGVCGGLVLKTSLNIACGYLKLSWYLFFFWKLLKIKEGMAISLLE